MAPVRARERAIDLEPWKARAALRRPSFISQVVKFDLRASSFGPFHFLRLGQVQNRHPPGFGLPLELLPRHEEGIAWRHLAAIFLRLLIQLLRLAQQQNRLRGQIIQQSPQTPRSALRPPPSALEGFPTHLPEEGVIAATSSREICVSGSKWRKDSNSSPKNSRRAGQGLVSG